MASPPAPFAPIPLTSLPCAACGAAGPAPEVILTAGPTAFCSIACARSQGWPWLQSEPAGRRNTTREVK